MKLSSFAERYSSGSGIVQLMDDLGDAMSGDSEMLMLGGGNPGQIPEMHQAFYERMQRILQQPTEFAQVIGNYDSPQGEKKFTAAVASLLNKQYGWSLTEKNVVLTAGSQSAFYLLFNALAGEFADGKQRKILLPLAPEYMGYTDVGITDGLFRSYRPTIEKLDAPFFKYHVDFSAITVDDDINAMCVSRPTNPTGNVITDDELNQLLSMCQQHDIPLIVDNAYGAPFPDIIYTDVQPIWNEQIILCLSLSKLGLPGVRTGIVVATEPVIEFITNMNAIMHLALGSFGPSLALDLVRSGEIMSYSHQVIKPFYQQKCQSAIEAIQNSMQGIDYYIHQPEGAIFIWLWFPQLPISSQELYQRLKERGVLILPGEYFFPGLDEDWEHRHQCIRLTYSQDDATVRQGIQLIADEIRALLAA